METVIWILHLLSAISVIVLVLLQHGKGADMGAAFGSGSSGSLFGASGSANFLSRTTGVLAALFFITSLGLTYLSSHKPEAGGVMDRAVPVQSVKPVEEAPVKSVDEDASSKATEIPE